MPTTHNLQCYNEMGYTTLGDIWFRTCLDHIVPKPDDEGIGSISLELVTELVQDLVKLGQIPCPNSCWVERETRTDGQGCAWGLTKKNPQPGLYLNK